ncbi:MAG: ribonuclease HII [Wolbachia endosymbiont of Fragariocoptes setiger]|nr:ribonuclease HII [Wolbachia endosymbiont of Fragariocoptes setiger]
MNPNFELENKLFGIIAGVDEVGRGSLAGPVISAAVIFTNRSIIINGINDSKKLTPKRRQILYNEITSVAKFAIGSASVEEINLYNILESTKFSMKRALINLDLELDYVLIDGNQAPYVKWPVKTIIKGDNLSISIAAASIIAKVYRDKIMDNLHKEYPHYDWNHNKGYGTKKHIDAIKLHGITKYHRKNFMSCRSYKTID